ncbi:MAG: tRNA pseudouridine(38-40) synthase TruA [Deltaproteobacteria bacterium]|jgi:tRNA pseudouridine38-40 synthase|nr:tRNA pseudouridine(38-40) synthase TruA [Deltaproteobacteria bacterium]
MPQNFKLTVAYEGSNFCGWQRQKEGPTVQGLLEEALSRVCDHPVTLHGSGRTDAGVHAQGQVANFLTNSSRTPAQILAGANSILPMEIAIFLVEAVDLDFHARFSAKGKCYSYDFGVSPVRDPLTLRRAWPVGLGLKWDLVESCFPYLVGEKDFAAFKSQGDDVKSTIRTVTKLELSKAAPRLIRLTVYGSGFLRHMVRTMAGTLVEVAKGRLKPQDLANILETGDRSQAGRTAPAQGLCLRRVFYEDWPF